MVANIYREAIMLCFIKLEKDYVSFILDRKKYSCHLKYTRYKDKDTGHYVVESGEYKVICDYEWLAIERFLLDYVLPKIQKENNDEH